MVHQETIQEQPGNPDNTVGLDRIRSQAYEAAALGKPRRDRVHSRGY